MYLGAQKLKFFLLIVIGLFAVGCKNESGEFTQLKKQNATDLITPDGVRLIERWLRARGER